MRSQSVRWQDEHLERERWRLPTTVSTVKLEPHRATVRMLLSQPNPMHRPPSNKLMDSRPMRHMGSQLMEVMHRLRMLLPAMDRLLHMLLLIANLQLAILLQWLLRHTANLFRHTVPAPMILVQQPLPQHRPPTQLRRPMLPSLLILLMYSRLSLLHQSGPLM